MNPRLAPLWEEGLSAFFGSHGWIFRFERRRYIIRSKLIVAKFIIKTYMCIKYILKILVLNIMILIIL